MNFEIFTLLCLATLFFRVGSAESVPHFIWKRNWLSGVEPPSETAYLGDPCDTTVNCIVPHSVCSKLTDTFWTRSQRFCACRKGYHPATGYCDINVKKSIEFDLENEDESNETANILPKSAKQDKDSEQQFKETIEPQTTTQAALVPHHPDPTKLSPSMKLRTIKTFLQTLKGKPKYSPFAASETFDLDGLLPESDGEESSEASEKSESTTSTTSFPTNPWGYLPAKSKAPSPIKAKFTYSMKDKFSPHLFPAGFTEGTTQNFPLSTAKPVEPQLEIQNRLLDSENLKDIVSNIARKVVENYIKTMFKSLLAKNKTSLKKLGDTVQDDETMTRKVLRR